LERTIDQQLRDDFRRDLEAAGFQFLGERGGHERWQGTIDVEWIDPIDGSRQSASHRVEVTTDSAFPFSKPKAFPRDEPPIQHQRHQSPNEEGALCLWPDEGFGWFPGLGVNGLLERIRDWFVHYHLNDWPDSDRPPDLHLYFPSNEPFPVMLIGEEWNPPKGEPSGRFLVRRNPERPERALAEAAGAGVTTFSMRTDERLLSLLGMGNTKPEASGVWFRLSDEPKPQPTLGAMLEDIDRSRRVLVGTALKELIGKLGQKVDAKRGTAVLALGYPDVQGQEQWLFLEVDVTALSPNVDRVRWSNPKILNQLPVRSFVTASVVPSAMLRRAGPVATQIEQRQVLIFGVGSVGSSVALLLAKAGLPKMRLVDTDVMMPGNTVRHVAGLLSVGEQKTIATKFEILSHVPSCVVTVEPGTWDPEILTSWIREADVVVDATANDSFSLLLNKLCVQQITPILFATTHRRAAIGRLRVVRPGEDACLVCHLFGHRYDDPTYPKIPTDDEGTFVEEGCGVPTLEASAPDIEATSNWTARTVLWLFQGLLGLRNHCLIVNSELADVYGELREVGIHWSYWPPVPECECCGRGFTDS
jgi:ThiF family